MFLSKKELSYIFIKIFYVFNFDAFMSLIDTLKMFWDIVLISVNSENTNW